VHDFGNHRQRAYRPRADTWNEEQRGEVGRTPIRCGSQIGVKARRQHIACPDLVMGRHHQMRQRKLRRNGWCDRSFNPARQSRQFARDPVRPQGVQNAKLTAARSFSTAIGEIDDLSLPDSIDGGVGLFDKTFQALGKPVIPASLLAVAIHSLLDDNPLATVGHNEPVQIEIKAILHGGAVDLGDEPARIRERRSVKSHPLPDCDKLLRRLPRMFAAAATDMNPKLIRERRYLKVIGWGCTCRPSSTTSRAYIIAWKLCLTMKAGGCHRHVELGAEGLGARPGKGHPPAKASLRQCRLTEIHTMFVDGIVDPANAAYVTF
jgi:hypothetical protein